MVPRMSIEAHNGKGSSKELFWSIMTGAIAALKKSSKKSWERSNNNSYNFWCKGQRIVCATRSLFSSDDTSDGQILWELRASPSPPMKMTKFVMASIYRVWDLNCASVTDLMWWLGSKTAIIAFASRRKELCGTSFSSTAGNRSSRAAIRPAIIL